MSDTWSILRCPTCGRAPGLLPGDCAGCGRDVRAAAGAFDLLTDAERRAADDFAAAYSRLRRSEGWAGEDGIEGPGHGSDRLWRPRREAARRAVPWMAGRIVLDVGSGGGWLPDLLAGVEVIAVDLFEPPPASTAALRVRGDMRRLPVADGAVDACVYCASLHHAPVARAIGEAERVLRPGGLLVVLESPFYKNAAAAAAAHERSRGYYREAGAGELADAYHPIAQDALESALRTAGLMVEVIELPQSWRLPGRLPRFPLLVARRAGSDDRGQEDDQ